MYKLIVCLKPANIKLSFFVRNKYQNTLWTCSNASDGKHAHTFTRFDAYNCCRKDVRSAKKKETIFSIPGSDVPKRQDKVKYGENIGENFSAVFQKLPVGVKQMSYVLFLRILLIGVTIGCGGGYNTPSPTLFIQ